MEDAVTALPAFDAVSKIEAELSAFWSMPDEQSGLPQAKVRSSTMNYVIVAAQAEVDQARQTTEALCDTHPGRAFILTTEGRLAPWDMKYDVRAACRLDGGAQPICYDWIEMNFGSMATERAGSVVAALALPEVPIVVELGKGAARTLCASLVPRAQRIVVDSAHTSPTRIAELIKGSGVGIGDRQFVRTFSYREFVARFFDDALEALPFIRKVTIARTPNGATDPAALFLGWLGSRLGFRFETKTRAIDRLGSPVEIALMEEPRADVDPGQITCVEIEASLHGEPLSLSCIRDKPAGVSWSRKGARSATHEHALGHRDEAWVLVKALDSLEADRVYREALSLAVSWSSL